MPVKRVVAEVLGTRQPAQRAPCDLDGLIANLEALGEVGHARYTCTNGPGGCAVVIVTHLADQAVTGFVYDAGTCSCPT